MQTQREKKRESSPWRYFLWISKAGNSCEALKSAQKTLKCHIFHSNSPPLPSCKEASLQSLDNGETFSLRFHFYDCSCRHRRAVSFFAFFYHIKNGRETLPPTTRELCRWTSKKSFINFLPVWWMISGFSDEIVSVTSVSAVATLKLWNQRKFNFLETHSIDVDVLSVNIVSHFNSALERVKARKYHIWQMLCSFCFGCWQVLNRLNSAIDDDNSSLWAEQLWKPIMRFRLFLHTELDFFEL